MSTFHKPERYVVRGAGLTASVIIGACIWTAGCTAGASPEFKNASLGTSRLTPDAEGHERVLDEYRLNHWTIVRLIATNGIPQAGERLVHVTEIDSFEGNQKPDGPYVQWCTGNTLVSRFVTAGLPWLGGDELVVRRFQNSPACTSGGLTPASLQMLPHGFLNTGSEGINP